MVQTAASLLAADPAHLAATLSEAKKRAVQQRVAAEQLLEQARILEERLAAEAEQARIASEHAHLENLSASAARALEAERDAARHVEICAGEHRALMQERATMQNRRDELQRSLDAARNEVAAAEARLAEARETLQQVTTAYSDTARRYDELCEYEATAAADSSAAEEALRERRGAQEALNEELHAAQAYAEPFNGHTPSLEAVEQLQALERQVALNGEAARRVAERRAADEARRSAR